MSMFRFQQFTVRQQRCGMKVGTDGVLLGAWALGGRHILDAGTGTGVIALMMAQRYPDALLTAIDIDADAVLQASENVMLSPFASRIRVLQQRVQDAGPPMPSAAAGSVGYDAIVCNPPFFVDALPSPDAQRTVARHATQLTYGQLMQAARRLLSADGELSVVVPSEGKRLMQDEACFHGLFPSRVCDVSTVAGRAPRRHLLAFRPHPCSCEHASLAIGDAQYAALTADFYLPRSEG